MTKIDIKMVNPNFDDRLIRILEKEVIKEKWRKKIRIKGVVTKKNITKKEALCLQ